MTYPAPRAHRCSLPPCLSRPAFTLIEIMVVITLLAIAVGGATLQLDGVTTRGRLRSAALLIEGYHRLARIEVISSGQPRRLVFGRNTSRCLLQRSEHDGLLWTWSTGLRFELPRGVRVARVMVPNTESSELESIRVHADGTATPYACVLSVGQLALAVVIDGIAGTGRHVEIVDPNVIDVVTLFTPEPSP